MMRELLRFIDGIIWLCMILTIVCFLWALGVELYQLLDADIIILKF